MKNLNSCGHDKKYVVSSDEGTSFCLFCAWEAQTKETERITNVNEKASCYIVIGYRFGWENKGGHHIWGGYDRDTAIAFAVKENSESSKKYATAVYKICGEEMKMVWYSSSSWGEETLRYDYTLDYHEGIGRRVVSLVEKSKVISHIAIKSILDSEKEVLSAMKGEKIE